jgi:hypothetical protein
VPGRWHVGDGGGGVGEATLAGKRRGVGGRRCRGRRHVGDEGGGRLRRRDLRGEAGGGGCAEGGKGREVGFRVGVYAVSFIYRSGSWARMGRWEVGRGQKLLRREPSKWLSAKMIFFKLLKNGK